MSSSGRDVCAAIAVYVCGAQLRSDTIDCDSTQTHAINSISEFECTFRLVIRFISHAKQIALGNCQVNVVCVDTVYMCFRLSFELENE